MIEMCMVSIAALVSIILTAILLKALLTMGFFCGYHRGKKAEAKKQVLDILNESDEKIYPSEIAERLHIGYDLCFEIIEELLKEGEIAYEEE